MGQSSKEQRDLELLFRAIDIAKYSRDHSNNPFGTVLADSEGNILLEAENTTLTDRDCTAHSDINIIRDAWREYEPEFLASITLYTSAEPCAMCAGAIVWANIRRVVYGLSNSVLYEQMGQRSDGMGHNVPCRQIFEGAAWEIEVIGPLLEKEAAHCHENYWHQKH